MTVGSLQHAGKHRTGAIRILLLAGMLGPGLLRWAAAQNRTLEFPLELSADPKSELQRRFEVLSPGRLVIEISSGAPFPQGRTLSLLLTRPDGSQALQSNVAVPSRSEYPVGDQEIDRFLKSGKNTWGLRIANRGESGGAELRGLLRLTVPANPRTLLDTQFKLLGYDNAQEIPFTVPARGRIQVEVTWQTDASESDPSPVPLAVSLIHTGTSTVHARRHNRSPQKIEHQVTDGETDAGTRWAVRIQNDSRSKVSGKVRVSFTPAY